MQTDILLISNAPGEVNAWLKPVARQLRLDFPSSRLTVLLVPCPYASGEERRIIESWNLGIQVWEPRESVRFLLGGATPEPLTWRDFGVVLFLGGDQFFGVLASRRTGYPLLTYTETTGRWASWVDRFLVADRKVLLDLRRKRVSPRKLSVVGNLMVDAVRPTYDTQDVRQKLGFARDARVVSLLPGSKPFKVKYMTPMLLRTAELLTERDPSLQFILTLSPFTPVSLLEEVLSDRRLHRIIGGCGGRLMKLQDRHYILTGGGTQIRVVGPEFHYPSLAIADLALTVPGTNTAELAILGVPMLVLLPLNKPEEIPIDGLLEHIGRVPFFGKRIKRAAVKTLASRQRFLAIPNARAERMVTPELRGHLTPDQVAEVAASLLDDEARRRQIRLALHETMGYPGAATAISLIVRETLASAARHLPRLLSNSPKEQQESN